MIFILYVIIYLFVYSFVQFEPSYYFTSFLLSISYTQ